jgi:DNA-binding SARP family transcriptional activator
LTINQIVSTRPDLYGGSVQSLTGDPDLLLRTFGGLAIEAGPGEGPAPALGPRRLALLALLAAAGSRGITREKILGILWPEADEEQARHTLSQTLYLLRRETGREWVSGTTLLRLHESIACDVRQFQDELAANRLARATELYTGAFLDGFYLAAAPEFEEWVEETRSRLRFTALKALETLTRLAVDQGDHAKASGWWQRLCELDPFSATYAAGRIRAFTALGDPSAALRFAQDYELRVRRELDAEPDPIIKELTAGLRTVQQPLATIAEPNNQIPLAISAVGAGNRTALARRNFGLPAALIALLATAVTVTAIVGTNSSRGATRDLGLEPPPSTVAAVSTRSAIAYALYEQGLRAKYQGDGPATYRLMMAALERDSTFAMAALNAWSYGRPEESAAILPLLRRLAEKAVDRERLYIQAALAEGRAPLREYVGIARELGARYPTDPDAQFMAANGLWGAGEWPDAIAAYNRAIAIDSMAGAIYGTYCRICGAMYTMSMLYLWWDSAAAAERTARRLVALRPDHSSGWEAAIEPLLRQGRRAEGEAAILRSAKLNAAQTSKDWLLDRDLIRNGRLDELEVRIISELRSAAPGAHGEGPWLLAFVLRNQGRLRDAENLAMHGVVPRIDRRLANYRDHSQLAIIALESANPRESARRFLDIAAYHSRGQSEPGLKARNIAWHMTLAGTALAAAGDTAAVRALADSVERIGANSSFGRDPKLHFFLRGLLLQRENRHAEAVDAFRRSLYSLTDGYTRTNLEMARSLMSLRRYPEAIAILQPALRGGVDGSNTYVTHTELRETLAQVFDAAGQRDSAAVHYAAVERAWRSADPQFSERYRIAKNRAASSN